MSVILVHGGGWVGGQTPLDAPGGDFPKPPLDADLLGCRPPWMQTPMKTDSHRGRPSQKAELEANTPPGCRPLVVTSNGGHCSGWYASFWNAFLFGKSFAKKLHENERNWTERGGSLVTSLGSANGFIVGNVLQVGNG